jgi:hypothetical protein
MLLAVVAVLFLRRPAVLARPETSGRAAEAAHRTRTP